jgi:hypothetical protein
VSKFASQTEAKRFFVEQIVNQASRDSSGNLTIRNSTVTGNTADYAGGLLAGMVATISSSTFADNQATDLGHYGPAGNIFVVLGPVTSRIRSWLAASRSIATSIRI